MPSRNHRGPKAQHRVSKRTKPAQLKTPAPDIQPGTSNSSSTSTASSPVYFWRESDPSTGYLSQWYPCAFSDDTDPSIIYRTAEHYMMYQKALLFNDAAAAAEILAAPHPREVRALGRLVANFDDDVWNARREAIVAKGNLLKFTRPVDVDDGWWVVRTPAQDGGDGAGEDELSIRELLLRTGEREIVEASPRDRIWGIGFGAEKAGSVRHRWGLNLLGKALMAVRAQLREQAGKGEGRTRESEEKD